MINPTLEDRINTLEIESSIIKKLNQNQIYYIKELWNLKRKNLKEFGLNDSEIKHITIKLQLHSIDLNKKIYHRN